jgi:hypothetical protein
MKCYKQGIIAENDLIFFGCFTAYKRIVMRINKRFNAKEII